jgi:membrane-associated phospholipid phosphatase
MPERARTAIVGAGILFASLLATWFAAFHVGLFAHADQSILRGFADLHWRPHVNRVAQFVADLCNPSPYIYFCAVPVLVALARRRLWVALAIIAILLGANVTTQLLKPLLAHTRPSDLLAGVQAPAASWPSGHATAAMALALSCVLAAPPGLRPLVAALGAVFAVAVSYSFLTLGWHYPSDVLGGFLVAAIWALLAIAAVFTANTRRPQVASRELVQRASVPEALGPPSAALAGALALGAAVAISRPQAVAAYARAHEAFMVGATAIAASGLALATGLMLALRSRGLPSASPESGRAPTVSPGRGSPRG